MNTCKCGCGTEVKKAGGFVRGHWSKMNKENKAKAPTPAIEQSAGQDEPINQISRLEIHPYTPATNDVAWFLVDSQYVPRPVEFYGTATSSGGTDEPVCTVMVVTPSGIILPPYLIEGFVGLYPIDQVFPEIEIEENAPASHTDPGDDSEAFPPFPVEETEGEEEHAPEKPKSKFSKLFSKKPKTEKNPEPDKKKEQAQEISQETRDLLKQIANAET